MAYTVQKLVTNAYNMAGIVSRDFETVEGSQLSDGIDSLNDLLGDVTVETGLIPYFSKYEFVGIQGIEEYAIPNLVEVSTLVFFLDQVRYQMWDVNRDAYFGSPRAQRIQSLPFNYHVEKQFGGAKIFMYFVPNQAYVFQLWGKFRLTAVTDEMQDLELVYDRFYIDYLKFALCQRLCINYSYPMPDQAAMELARIKKGINKLSGPLDFTQKFLSTLDNIGFTISYAQVNLGKGFIPV